MAGKIRQDALGRSDKWRIECRELALTLGFQESEIWHQFEQLAWAREFEQRYPRRLAEMLAFADVRAVFDKRGEDKPS